MPSNPNMLKFSKYTYLDNNATTKISASVRERMMPFLDIQLGNPSSNTSVGRTAKKAIDRARRQIADEIDAQPQEIFFTSCGSESNSWAISSCADLRGSLSKNIIITTQVEHDSVKEHIKYLNKQYGFEIIYLETEKNGDVKLTPLNNINLQQVLFASVMLVNNELGTVYDETIKQLHTILSPHSIPLHCDAIQALGKIRFSVKDLGVSFLSLSGHKVHAPKGVGVLYIKEGQPSCQLVWGHQEKHRRGGTENVASIVGFGQAVHDAYNENDETGSFEEKISRLKTMRDYIEKSVVDISGHIINGRSDQRVANTTNLGFVGIDAIKLSLLLEQRGIFISNGAACNEVDPQHSHVLKAIDSPAYDNGAIRVSLSNENTEYDAEYFVENLKYCVSKLRGGI